MPVVFGKMVSTVQDSLDVFRKHGDRVRGTYRAHYRFDPTTLDPYTAPRLERPEALRDNPADVVYPWEQIFLAAAACAGSDYPMFAAHFEIPFDSVELVVEGVFDPRGEFDGVSGFHAPGDARHCFLSLKLRATIVSSAPRATLEQLHARVVSQNMVLGALRGIPQTNELVTRPARARAEAMAGGVR